MNIWALRIPTGLNNLHCYERLLAKHSERNEVQSKNAPSTSPLRDSAQAA